MGILERFEYALLVQRGHLFPWAPVCFGCGIGAYFSLQFEPVFWTFAVLAACSAMGFLLALWRPTAWTPLACGMALAAAGFCIAGARAHMVGAPVLDWRYYGPVEGRVVAIDRSASDAVRLTLDQVRLSDARAPAKVRVSLHGDAVDFDPRPGAWVMTTAYLSPPQGPAEPGGFDFRRHAWFQQLGAVGYTRVPVLIVAPPKPDSLRAWIFALRMGVSSYVQTVLPGDVGGFAAAVTTGDRSGVSQSALQDLRDSNLAHLLAISGLHMGLLAGFVFAALRIALSLFPAFALRRPVKKLAALGAMAIAAVYLALSGGNVATERAFIMVTVALCAVLTDRRALSVRAVAMAAMIVLILRPEALLSPGFQMSFAATTALVAVFNALRDDAVPVAPAWMRPGLGVLMSSAVAGAATAPVAAAHFNQIAQFGLIANLLSVPLMGILVIPAAVIAMCLAPIGLDAVALWVMGLGLRWILAVAETVAGWSASVRPVPSPDPMVLPLICLGALWVMLWQGRARLAGVLPILAGVWLWVQSERPDVLIADTGKLVGVMTDEGRALSRSRGSGFIAGVWLENDGDRADQPVAADRWGSDEPVQRWRYGSFELVHVTGKTGAKAFTTCMKEQIVIAAVAHEPSGPCQVYGPAELRRMGSVALTQSGPVTARDRSGDRLWSPDQ